MRRTPADREQEYAFITRFPSLYAFLVGAPLQQKTPPCDRRGSPTNGLTQNGDTQDMVVAVLERSKPPGGRSTGYRLTEADQLTAWLSRGREEVFTVTTTLTPTLAALLTQRNEENRPVIWKGGNRSVEGYAAAMRRGEWKLNGKGLVVSRCGLLNDGQHRCYAVLDCQESIPVQITFGVDRDTRHTVDQGIARTPGHILAMAGEVNTNQLACALQMLWCIDNGESHHSRPSMDQLQATLDRHPAIREAIPAASKLFSRYRLSAGYIAAAHHLCRSHDASAADLFLADVTTGLNIKSVNSPVARLRKQFEEHSAKRKPINRDEQAALYIKGFNNFIRGRQGALVWRNTGPAAEAFPVVGG